MRWVIILILLLSACSAGMEPQEVLASVDTTLEVKEFTLGASDWEFTGESIVVKKGDVVRLRVKVVEGAHGLALPDFGVATGVLGNGMEEVVEFTADKTGTFEYFCNVPCGSGHRQMRGTITVE